VTPQEYESNNGPRSLYLKLIREKVSAMRLLQMCPIPVNRTLLPRDVFWPKHAKLLWNRCFSEFAAGWRADCLVYWHDKFTSRP
jgi:hypothetical protein